MKTERKNKGGSKWSVRTFILTSCKRLFCPPSVLLPWFALACHSGGRKWGMLHFAEKLRFFAQSCLQSGVGKFPLVSSAQPWTLSLPVSHWTVRIFHCLSQHESTLCWRDQHAEPGITGGKSAEFFYCLNTVRERGIWGKTPLDLNKDAVM